MEEHERDVYPSERGTQSSSERALMFQKMRESLRRLRSQNENQEAPAPVSDSVSPPVSAPVSSPVSPVSESDSSPVSASVRTSNGWDQGDGRRALQLEIYDSIPKEVRARLEPTKLTHFHFRYPSDEKAFLQALTENHPTWEAVYHLNGKKDVTLSSESGLIGNIHFLFMDGPDVHRPEKYYVKFFLFNFVDTENLLDVKQRILSFFESFPASPSHSQGHTNHTLKNHKGRKGQKSHKSHKAHKSQKSHKSHKSHKAYKSHKAHKSHKSHKGQKSRKSHKSHMHHRPNKA